MKHIALTSSFLLALSQSVFAADDLKEAGVAGFSWTGSYVGVQAGYLSGEGCYCIAIFPGSEANGDIGGMLGGVYAGHNRQFFSNLVLGVDFDLGGYGVDDFVQFAHPTYPPSSGLNYRLKWGGAARLRVGYATDRWLPYVAGGAAFAKAEFADLYNATTLEKNELNLKGWTLGAGIDFALTDKMILRADYRYTDFGDFKFDRGLQTSTGSITANDVRVGVAVKF